MKKKELSVIIPTLNEEKTIKRCLECIIGIPDTEIIISDGGSTDKTVEIARQFPEVKVLSSPKGRGVQMNRGALYAHGEILLFLHADGIIAKEAVLTIRNILKNDQTGGGAFQIHLLSDRFPYRLLEIGINLRSRVFQLPYGDQGLFLKRSVFAEMGGFREMDVCEDLDLVWRLRKKYKIVIVNKKISSSVRRWEKNGIMKTSLRNLFLLASYVSKHALPHFRLFSKA